MDDGKVSPGLSAGNTKTASLLSTRKTQRYSDQEQIIQKLGIFKEITLQGRTRTRGRTRQRARGDNKYKHGARRGEAKEKTGEVETVKIRQLNNTETEDKQGAEGT